MKVKQVNTVMKNLNDSKDENRLVLYLSVVVADYSQSFLRPDFPTYRPFKSGSVYIRNHLESRHLSYSYPYLSHITITMM